MTTVTTPLTDQMNVVIVGHVDHGKSTLVGRLFADTGSLPKGKLDQVKAMCEINSKPFEYAFLLDALKDEQAQGITIDTARAFFKTKKRHYIIIDAPGHIEFLKNMVSGAARAQAALLLIDAHEGVQENSRRHGYMLSMLGIKQVVVIVNKMDLVDYREDTFNNVVTEYTAFLNDINVSPVGFIPISAREGDNLIATSPHMPWYKGLCVLDQLDAFTKEEDAKHKPFRLPVQDIYKFTQENDDRRIVAGTIQTGSIKAGDDVLFLPSGKTSTIKSIEAFNCPPQTHAVAGQATGVTLTTQIYIKPGELMCKQGDVLPHTGTSFKANIFWLGKKPMVKSKRYKLKCASAQAFVYLSDIHKVLDASNLNTNDTTDQIGRHDVAEISLQTLKPIAFDETAIIEPTGRFVIIDDYEIAGGGIITGLTHQTTSYIDTVIQTRNAAWIQSSITQAQREQRAGHKPHVLIVTGQDTTQTIPFSQTLEHTLFTQGKTVYNCPFANLLAGQDPSDTTGVNRETIMLKMGEIAHLLADSGAIVILTVVDLDDDELAIINAVAAPFPVTLINTGQAKYPKAKHVVSAKELNLESLNFL